MSAQPIEPDHLADVAAVSAVCFAAPWSVDELRSTIARPVTRARVVFDEADRIVGYAIAYVVVGEAEVLSIAVLPDARRQGRGRALLASLLDGCDCAHLEVRSGARPAQRLYAAFGFVESYRRAKYYADGDDAIVMRWTR